jgi:hypothetical protein
MVLTTDGTCANTITFEDCYADDTTESTCLTQTGDCSKIYVIAWAYASVPSYYLIFNFDKYLYLLEWLRDLLEGGQEYYILIIYQLPIWKLIYFYKPFLIRAPPEHRLNDNIIFYQ